MALRDISLALYGACVFIEPGIRSHIAPHTHTLAYIHVHTNTLSRAIYTHQTCQRKYSQSAHTRRTHSPYTPKPKNSLFRRCRHSAFSHSPSIAITLNRASSPLPPQPRTLFFFFYPDHFHRNSNIKDIINYIVAGVSIYLLAIRHN